MACLARATFARLLDEVAAAPGRYAMLYTDTRGSLDFKAEFVDFPIDREVGGGLQQRAHQTDWKCIPNLSDDGTMLLIPPLQYKASDVSDFVRRYRSRADWETIVDGFAKAIEDNLNASNSNVWVYTHGCAEPYLHVRYEPFTKRKYR